MISNSFRRYDFQYPATKYVVTESDVARPDLMSIKIYGRNDWWWFLMKYNGIDDVWNELYMGMVIAVPDVRDINIYTVNNARN